MARCAALLAGGLGTRLRSVVSDRPKVMAMVAGRPFITYLLDQLAEAAVERVVLCTGYMADVIRKELGNGYRDMELVYSEEEAPLGTGGALHHASSHYYGDLLLVLNGDSYCQCNLDNFIDGHAASGASAAMVLTRVADVSRFGAVHVNGAHVDSFIEKGGQSGSGWINAGIYLLPTCVIEKIAPGQQISLEKEVIPSLMTHGIYGHPCTGQFIDIGIPEEYQRAQTFFSAIAKEKP